MALPTSEEPRVSVVIPAHNHYGVTRRCLLALAYAPTRVPFEVIVVVANGAESEQLSLGERTYNQLQDAGVDVLLDDRAERAGVNSNVLADHEALDPLSGTSVLNGIPVDVVPV